MIWAVRVPASPARASRSCWRRSAKVGSAPIVSIEASSLARNGRDWHTLLEFCGLVGTLIVDEDGVYDPRHPNDRLLLGMKGTMSEMELFAVSPASLEALKQKARRGELFTTVAIGYLRTSHDHIEKDPDRRVRKEAIMLAFGKVRQSCRPLNGGFIFGCARGTYPLPATVYGPEGRKIVWKLPVYNTLHAPAQEPDLCRCLRLQENWKSDHDRGRAQTDRARLPQGSHRLGGF